MRAFLAVARREIEEKRFVFGAALVASVVPLLVPIVRGLHGQPAQETRETLAVALAGAFAVGLGIAFGSTVLASELAERRISFYFSRPVSGVALWAGKLCAACLIALATAALVYGPAIVLDRQAPEARLLGEALPIVALGAVTVTFAFHGVGIALRERSALLLADLAAVIVSAAGAGLALRRLVLATAMEPFFRAIGLLPLLAAIVLAAAGLVAILRGRADIRAAHRALSVALWIGLGLLAAGLGVYSSWVLSATPRSMRAIDSVLPARRGSWIVVQGEARGGEPVFLLEPLTDRHLRVGGTWSWPVFSPDGTRAAWFEPSEIAGSFELVTWDLSDSISKPRRTNLSFTGTPVAFLSEHGERMATVEKHLLSVYDLSSQALLGSARLGEEHAYLRGFFADPGHFRLYRVRAPEVGGIEILEFDVAKKALAKTGEMAGAESLTFTASGSGDRILLREKTRLTLRDGRSGALEASLANRGPTTRSSGIFLSDGRIAASIVERSAVRIEIFGPDGRPERTISIPARDRVSLGGEIAPGRLVVAAGGNADIRESRTIFLADLSSGEVVKVAEGLFPVCTFMISRSDPSSLPVSGSEATKLFYGPGRSLVHFDPLTGERRVILGKEK